MYANSGYAAAPDRRQCVDCGRRGEPRGRNLRPRAAAFVFLQIAIGSNRPCDSSTGIGEILEGAGSNLFPSAIVPLVDLAAIRAAADCEHAAIGRDLSGCQIPGKRGVRARRLPCA